MKRRGFSIQGLHLLMTPALVVVLVLTMLLPLSAAPPRKGIVYRPTPDGGRACFIDGVQVYQMPPVPKGMYGATFGVDKTPALADGPLDQRDWAPYLSGKGLRFERGASASFFQPPGHLVVVNTREQLALLMKWAGVASEER